MASEELREPLDARNTVLRGGNICIPHKIKVPIDFVQRSKEEENRELRSRITKAQQPTTRKGKCLPSDSNSMM
jgi:hypothetical protein